MSKSKKTNKISFDIDIGAKVQLIPPTNKQWHWRYLKGEVHSFNENTEEIAIKLSRNFRKYSYGTNILLVKRHDIVQISDYEFDKVSFVDIGEKVRLIKGKFKGMAASISGYRQDWDYSSSLENREGLKKSALGDFVAAYLDLKDGNESHLTVGLVDIEFISEEEYHNSFIVNNKNQILLF